MGFEIHTGMDTQFDLSAKVQRLQESRTFMGFWIEAFLLKIGQHRLRAKMNFLFQNISRFSSYRRLTWTLIEALIETLIHVERLILGIYAWEKWNLVENGIRPEVDAILKMHKYSIEHVLSSFMDFRTEIFDEILVNL